ncbi:MAG: NIPSNAP family protein [Chloroflexi bacterium]|nr:MAG: NIPSNAP family protein [Chloroflexota bacterium]
MIVEMRTYNLRPGATAEYEQRVAAGLEHRTQFSPLAAWWHTDIGTLNQVIHLWPYESMAQRDEVRRAALKPGVWPPDGEDLVLTQESKILAPASFSPSLEPREIGPIFEIRTYQLKPGAGDQVATLWAGPIAERVTHSPLVFAGVTQLGQLHEWIHIWAYNDLNERVRVRAEVAASGHWPPRTREFIVSQQNAIALPATFSQIR